MRRLLNQSKEKHSLRIGRQLMVVPTTKSERSDKGNSAGAAVHAGPCCALLRCLHLQTTSVTSAEEPQGEDNTV